MKRVAAAAMALVLAFGALDAPPVTALSWPLASESQLIYGPAFYPGTSNIWCGFDLNGSYGSVYFTQTQAWVNYGGSCNATWGRPTNYLRARAKAFTGSTIRADSGYVYNAYGASLAQANVAYNPTYDTYYWLNAYWIGSSYTQFVGFRV